jgi:hypothetical protein
MDSVVLSVGSSVQDEPTVNQRQIDRYHDSVSRERGSALECGGLTPLC